jgi:hypothetical protein
MKREPTVSIPINRKHVCTIFQKIIDEIVFVHLDYETA